MVLLLVIFLLQTRNYSRILNIINVLRRVPDHPYINQLASNVLIILRLQLHFDSLDQYILRNTNLMLLHLALLMFLFLLFDLQMLYLPSQLLLIMVIAHPFLVYNLLILVMLLVDLFLLIHEFFHLQYILQVLVLPNIFVLQISIHEFYNLLFYYLFFLLQFFQLFYQLRPVYLIHSKILSLYDFHLQ